MKKVEIRAASKTYQVFIGSGLRHQIGSQLKSILSQPPSSVFIISDTNVAPKYLDDLKASFDEELSVFDYVIKSGEASKSFQVYEDVLTKALESNLDRKSIVVALGGGVVGDLAGFVAATYMRGIRFVQVPTTLLAHDSSVGGKVAINHPLGKNMIGSFHQPEVVFYDTETLYSLPNREWRSGFAEVIKHGFIRDRQFLEELERDWISFENIPIEQLNTMLEKSISVKADVVAEDEKELGVRAHLNLGHTLGHALEAELGYGVMTHGEAVAIGILYAMRLSEEMNQIDLNIPHYEEWFKRLGYETRIPAFLTGEKLLKTMSQDKKVEAGTIRMVLLEKIGQATMSNIPPNIILSLIEERMEEGSRG